MEDFFQEMIDAYTDFFKEIDEAFLIYLDKEEIPETPYFFKKKTLIRDKRPHKQHRIRNNCRKERFNKWQKDECSHKKS